MNRVKLPGFRPAANAGKIAKTAVILLALAGLAAFRPARSQITTTLAPFTQTLPGSVVKIRMVPVPGGTVKLGGQIIEVKPFWIATTETPWEGYDAFTSSGPPSKPYDQTKYAPDAIARPSRSYIPPDHLWGHHGFPAISISSTSALMFCRWLAAGTQKKFRLPSQAEWVLACRLGEGGTAPTAAQLAKEAWYAANSKGTTHAVATKLPDKLGLYDMLGNVGEWADDPDGKPVLCGGTFQDDAAHQTPDEHKYWAPKWQEEDPQIPKSRWWLSDAPFAGFRVVCDP